MSKDRDMDVPCRSESERVADILEHEIDIVNDVLHRLRKARAALLKTKEAVDDGRS